MTAFGYIEIRPYVKRTPAEIEAEAKQAVDAVNDFTRRMLHRDWLERALRRSRVRWTPPRMLQQFQRALSRLDRGLKPARCPHIDLDYGPLSPPLSDEEFDAAMAAFDAECDAEDEGWDEDDADAD